MPNKTEQVSNQPTKSFLTEDELLVYKELVSLGKSTVAVLFKKTPFKKSLLYHILERLCGRGLVIKGEYRGVAFFEPMHPKKILDLFNEEKQRFQSAEEVLKQEVVVLTQQYNHNIQKPNIRFFEGAEGIKVLYNDILDTGSPIQLLRSSYDDDSAELSELVQKQITEQVALGISTKAITPLKPGYTLDDKKYTDKENLVTRKSIVYKDKDPKAQILIYGGKVAFTAYTQNIITTIIESKEIADAVSILFDEVWEK